MATSSLGFLDPLNGVNLSGYGSAGATTTTAPTMTTGSTVEDKAARDREAAAAAAAAALSPIASGQPLQGSGSGRPLEGWATVYHANENLAPQYMDQYGAGADARLADLQYGAVSNSYAAGFGGQQIGQQYGGLASQFGQGAAQSLVGQGANAAKAGAAGQANALATQGYLNTAANAAGTLGTGANITAQNYANRISDTAGAGTQAAQFGQDMIQGALGSLFSAGEQSSNTGFNAAGQINQAAQGITAAGQTGSQIGQQGAANATEQARSLQQAGVAGQRAISNVGQTAGQMGMGVADQGQRFLGQQGYQANLGESNAARNLAQQNAQALAGVESREGPSAAQAQLRQGLNQAQSANLAMARSGRGFGGSASALSQAQNLNAQAGQTAANQSAMLRAQEDAAFRQRQAANYQAAGGINLQAGQQALSREQMLAQQQLAQQQANQSAYLQAQGIGQQGLGQQASAEQAAYQQLLAGQQAAAGQQLAGSQLGMQGAGMNLSAQQANAAAAAQAGQMGLAGLGQNITAQQAAAQAAGQMGQLGLAGANQAMQAQTAAGQMGLAGYNAALQGNQQMQAGLLSGGQLAQAGANTNLQGIQAGIGATNAAATQGLAGILGGGQLGLAGNQQLLQGVAQAGALGMTAEQQRAANAQYATGLEQAQIANTLQIAGMEAGLNVQNAGMTNQLIGSGIQAGAALLPALAALSDVNAKTDIVPLGSGRQPPTQPEQPESGAMTQGSYAQNQKQPEQTIKISIAPQGGGQTEGAEGGAMTPSPAPSTVYSSNARQALAAPVSTTPVAQGQVVQTNNPAATQAARPAQAAMTPGYQSEVSANPMVRALMAQRPEQGFMPQGELMESGLDAPGYLMASPQSRGMFFGGGPQRPEQAPSFPDAVASFGVRQPIGGLDLGVMPTQAVSRNPMVLSDEKTKTKARLGSDPYGIDYGADLMKKKDEEDKKKGMEKAQPFMDVLQNFGASMQGGGGNLAVNPITGLGWGAAPMGGITAPTVNPYNQMDILSDERAKYGQVVSDERSKEKAGEMVSGLDPYAFRYKDPARHGQGVHYGIMAQDLERSPAGRSVVEQGADGLKRVNTPKLTMLNSAALAQYDDRLSDIEQRIANMGGPKNDNGKKKTRAA